MINSDMLFTKIVNIIENNQSNCNDIDEIIDLINKRLQVIKMERLGFILLPPKTKELKNGQIQIYKGTK